MKKVLLIKLECSSYSSIGMETAFREAFEEVRSIDWQRIKFDNGQQGMEVLWNEIITVCKDFRPDLIFVQIQKSGVLEAEHFKELSNYGFVINYTEDIKEENVWYESIAPHIGLTVFTNMEDCETFWSKGLRAAYMMVSYNHLVYRPQPKTRTDYGDIVFIGNSYLNTALNFPQAQERVDMCKFLKQKFGARFQAYGMGQENQMLKPYECVEAYNNCKVAITHNNFKREMYCSDRGLNAMGCGAVTIHQAFGGISEFFKFDPYLYVWNDFNDLEETCDQILANEIFENKILIAESTRINHSWKARIDKGFPLQVITMDDEVKYIANDSGPDKIPKNWKDINTLMYYKKINKGMVTLTQHPDTPKPIIRRNEKAI